MAASRKEFGKHYIIEFVGCDPEVIKQVPHVREHLLAAVRVSGATMLGDHFHQFQPWGVTGMVFIAESHFSIHTWPEDHYAAVDILTCGEMLPEKAIEYLRSALVAQHAYVTIVSRGFDVPEVP